MLPCSEAFALYFLGLADSWDTCCLCLHPNAPVCSTVVMVSSLPCRIVCIYSNFSCFFSASTQFINLSNEGVNFHCRHFAKSVLCPPPSSLVVLLNLPAVVSSYRPMLRADKIQVNSSAPPQIHKREKENSQGQPFPSLMKLK